MCIFYGIYYVPCAYFVGYTVYHVHALWHILCTMCIFCRIYCVPCACFMAYTVYHVHILSDIMCTMCIYYAIYCVPCACFMGYTVYHVHILLYTMGIFLRDILCDRYGQQHDNLMMLLIALREQFGNIRTPVLMEKILNDNMESHLDLPFSLCFISWSINLFILRQNDWLTETKWPHFSDSIFRLIFLYGSCMIVLIQMSLQFVPKNSINNNLALV